METNRFYNEILTEHNLHPEFKHDLPDADIELAGVNPSCGDEIRLKLKTDGQTITAAIGQSYNLFTPLQLANYVATLVSGGEHYAAHLLKTVKSYDNSRLIYAYDEEPLNDMNISDSTMAAVTKGMHDLTHDSLTTPSKAA